MADIFLTSTFRVLPFQVIHDVRGLILRRGMEQIILSGPEAADVLRDIVEALHPDGATPEEVAARFAEPDRPRVYEFLRHLSRRRFIVPLAGEAPREPESGLDVFYWQLGHTPAAAARALAGLTLAFVGINRLVCLMASALAELGVGRIEIVDDPLLRGEDFFGPDGALSAAWPARLPVPREAGEWKRTLAPGRVDCLVAASDFGGQQLLLGWNRLAVEHGLHFLPVTQQDLMGYVGPLVVPGDTACLACLRARQNANLLNAEEKRAAEAHAHEGRWASAVHPAMLAVLAEVAAFEIHRFYAGLPQWKVGQLIEVSLLTASMARRKVLKAPRCPVCSPLHDGVPTNLRKVVPLTAVMNR